MADKIKIQVLEDGTIKVSTDKISMPNHMNAEQLLKQMFALAGGTVVSKAKHAFQHAFGRTHDHDHDQQRQ